MKLMLVDDNGNVLDTVVEVELYDLTKVYARAALAANVFESIEHALRIANDA